MLKAIFLRALLFLLPLALGYLWRALSEGGGSADHGPESPHAAAKAPRWPWLIVAGALLVVLSLIGGVFLPHGPDRGIYIPGEVKPGGSVSPGRFIPGGNQSS